jgi:hypothetical protein
MPGEVIVLAPGSYGDLTVRRPGVTIQGPADAVVRSINVISPGNGVTLRGFTVQMAPNAATVSTLGAVRFASVTDAVVDGLTITCGNAVVGVSPDADPTMPRPGNNVLGLPTGTGLVLQNVARATVTNCDISRAFAGVQVSDASGLLIDRCHVHDVRTSGIHGSVLGDITITNNRLEKAAPWKLGGAGDHADGVHLWTDPAKAALGRAMNIVVSDNLLIYDVALLPIYLDDNSNGIGYGAADISRNVILGAHALGVALENVQGQANDNVLLPVAGDPAHNMPGIYPTAGSIVALNRNTASDLQKSFANAPPANSNVSLRPTAAMVAALAKLVT